MCALFCCAEWWKKGARIKSNQERGLDRSGCGEGASRGNGGRQGWLKLLLARGSGCSLLKPSRGDSRRSASIHPQSRSTRSCSHQTHPSPTPSTFAVTVTVTVTATGLLLLSDACTPWRAVFEKALQKQFDSGKSVPIKPCLDSRSAAERPHRRLVLSCRLAPPHALLWGGWHPDWTYRHIKRSL